MSPSSGRPSPDDLAVRIRVTEVFHSIQGESTLAGWPCAFVRLTGCPLRCVYCDTAYAFHGGSTRTVSAVLDDVRAFGCPLVEVTGGEPLAQRGSLALMRALARTLAKLHDAGFSHSDPNFSNWLICGEPYPNPKLVAIDLDGVRKVGFMTAKSAAKDLYRLVRYMTPYERRWFVAQYSRARTRRLCAHEFDRLCQAYI